MSTELVRHEPQALAVNAAVDPRLMETVLLQGDLKTLAPNQRVDYYGAVCRSLGLNPLTRPFEYVNLQGKLTLYAKRECTEQLRKIHGISLQIVARELHDDVYVVTARAKSRDGREDESTGAVTVGGLKGENKANALMKAETKAKRRVTLSICGLAFLDESEHVDGATRVVVDDGGEIQGLDGGSKEAAQAVAAAKIVSAKSQLAELPTAPPPEEPGADIKRMMAGFAMVKQDLFIATGSNAAYYRVLGDNGFEHANEIIANGGLKKARAIYKQMAAALKDSREQITDADIPTGSKN